MHNAPLVQAVDAQQQVFHEPADLLFGEALLYFQQGLHLVVHVLHHDENPVSLGVATYLLDFDDVLVRNGFQDGDLAKGRDGEVTAFGQLELLDGYYLFGVSVLSPVDHPVDALVDSVQPPEGVDVLAALADPTSDLPIFVQGTGTLHLL